MNWRQPKTVGCVLCCATRKAENITGDARGGKPCILFLHLCRFDLICRVSFGRQDRLRSTPTDTCAPEPGGEHAAATRTFGSFYTIHRFACMDVPSRQGILIYDLRMSSESQGDERGIYTSGSLERSLSSPSYFARLSSIRNGENGYMFHSR